MSTPGTPRHRLLLAFLIAALLLLVETAAAAHELQHALHGTDNLSCQLHLFADHFAKTPASDSLLVPVVAQHDDQPPAPPVMAIARIRPFLYRPRAPPVSS